MPDAPNTSPTTKETEERNNPIWVLFWFVVLGAAGALALTNSSYPAAAAFMCAMAAFGLGFVYVLIILDDIHQTLKK